MSFSRFKPVHIVANNAPAIRNVMADDFISSTRLFTGAGAPAAGTLKAGNGKYQAALSGALSGFAISTPGVGYQSGDILTPPDGVAAPAAQIVVDNITTVGGIADAHFNNAAGGMGNYTTLPAQTNALTGGHGAGAIFLLYPPIADWYLDTNATALYVCTQAGTSAGSQWKQISGGTQSGNAYSGTWVPQNNYNLGSIVRVNANSFPGVSAGIYGCVINVVLPLGGNPVGTQIPQFPEPNGAHWQLICPPLQLFSECQNGTSATYIPATAPLV